MLYRYLLCLSICGELGLYFCQGRVKANGPETPCERNSKQGGHTSNHSFKPCVNLFRNLSDLYSEQDQLQPLVNTTMNTHAHTVKTGIVFIRHNKQAHTHTLYIYSVYPEDPSGFLTKLHSVNLACYSYYCAAGFTSLFLQCFFPAAISRIISGNDSWQANEQLNTIIMQCSHMEL